MEGHYPSAAERSDKQKTGRLLTGAFSSLPGRSLRMYMNDKSKFFAIIALGLAAAVTAAPAPQLDCTRDGFFCEPCVNGKQQCVACADGTGLGLVRDC
ncbi:hypothetical protein NCS57_01414100 [Fusarium keratoplasticum]|uniref:Uncharacterized protein n=1 Tax=Fusarium keratoplasticum TaxID=1328300 RepID=A0ACC0QDE6_9HYPO|nr:hypothetical protein NCS57_01414100 [Fusarium keratoplasticum]KAI8650792.1 hypothetical protein NCS57_01414100 [Fusarium keratoplasticum]